MKEESTKALHDRERAGLADGKGEWINMTPGRVWKLDFGKAWLVRKGGNRRYGRKKTLEGEPGNAKGYEPLMWNVKRKGSYFGNQVRV